MGRELKRVPIDFKWPLNKVWQGYLNPHYVKCSACDGRETTEARQLLGSLVSLIMIAGEDGRRGKLHPYLTKLPNRDSNSCPGADMYELTAGLAGRESSFFGHDACDNYSAEKKIIEAAGLDPDVWGMCKECEDGVAKTSFAAYSAWEQTEPPVGDGYQIWETCSEGSPITPVFASLDELCEWAEDGATTFGHSKTSAAEWKRMLMGGMVAHQVGNMTFI